MRHKKSGKKFNRNSSHRKSLFRNMAISLLHHGFIETTISKAKEIRRIVEKLITRSKENNLHNIRLVSKVIKRRDLLFKLFNKIGPKYINRKGGYTRIIRNRVRTGDNALLSIIELV